MFSPGRPRADAAETPVHLKMPGGRSLPRVDLGEDERRGEQNRAEQRWAGRLIRDVSFGDRCLTPGVPSAFGLGCTRAVADAERMLAALVTGSTRWLRPPPALTRSGSPGLLLPPASQSRCGNNRLESRVRENRTHGSEGGEAQAFPTPIKASPSLANLMALRVTLRPALL